MPKTNFYPKYNYDPSRVALQVQNETHTIPMNPPYQIFLRHIPAKDTVVIPGFTQVNNTPGEGQFQVFYKESRGRIRFNINDQGKEIQVSYDAIGSVIWAETSGQTEGINKIQEAINQAELNIDAQRSDFEEHSHSGTPGEGPKLDPTVALTYVPINKAGDSMEGYLLLFGDPTQPLHAATKQYVDAVQQGLDVKDSVRVATTESINLSGIQTIDGVLLEENDRVLVKDQTNKTQNGIYEVTNSSWVRSYDANTSDKVTPGMYTFVEEGDKYASSGFVLATTGEIELGVTELHFVRFTGAGQIEPGPGIAKDGNIIYIPASAVTAAMLEESYMRTDTDTGTSGSMNVGHNLNVGGDAEVGGDLLVSDSITFGGRYRFQYNEVLDALEIVVIDE